VLDRVEHYLAELASRALHKSDLSKAMPYAQNQRQALRRYTKDGRLTIDNNVSERTLRLDESRQKASRQRDRHRRQRAG